MSKVGEGKRILVPGGAGYIGSHTVVSLLEQGYDVTVVDSLVNSSEVALERVKKITGKEVEFFKVDLMDFDALEEVFKQYPDGFHATIHFAGLKAVGESVQEPLLYYRTNLNTSINLLTLMDKYNCRKFVFSSSATVYGASPVPYKEDSVVGQGITNPYGMTKCVIERVVTDFWNSKGGAQSDWQMCLLRYFNPIGAHPSGLIGEDPLGIPNNLMPYVAQVAVGKRRHLTVFGNDYPTPDGTGVRDYLHVVDLANGHTKAVERFDNLSEPVLDVFNLGTGKGTSVLEMVEAMEKASGKEIKYVIGPRRDGDLAESFAVPDSANSVLDWRCEKTIEDCCVDTWRWQSNNPNGYRDVQS